MNTVIHCHPTFEVALDARGRNALGQHGRAPLDSPRNQQLSGVLVKLLGDLRHSRVVDNTASLELVQCNTSDVKGSVLPWNTKGVVSKGTVCCNENVLQWFL